MPRTRKAPPSLIPPLSIIHPSCFFTTCIQPLPHHLFQPHSIPRDPKQTGKKPRSDCITFHIINIVESILLIELKVLTSWPQPDCLVSIPVPPEPNSIRSAFYCSQNTCPFPPMAVLLPTLFPLFRSLSPLPCLENSYCPSPWSFSWSPHPRHQPRKRA